MTRNEFDAWLDRHQQLFPEVAQFLAARGESMAWVLDEWFRAMAHIKAERAQAITRQMVTGAVEHPNNFEISRLPAAFCAIVPRVPSIDELNRGGIQQ